MTGVQWSKLKPKKDEQRAVSLIKDTLLVYKHFSVININAVHFFARQLFYCAEHYFPSYHGCKAPGMAPAEQLARARQGSLPEAQYSKFDCGKSTPLTVHEHF